MKGYPPSIFSWLQKVLERTGITEKGSITPVFTVAVVGDTLQAVDGALQALVPCALPYGLDPALQPQGWLSGRCRVVREPASGTLWVGVAAAAEPGGGAAAADAPSHEAFKVSLAQLKQPMMSMLERRQMLLAWK
jgi:hypothetical protein